jgi:outer-membrane receptor for ferric coprogen and ferric-rhodotorulic acid
MSAFRRAPPPAALGLLATALPAVLSSLARAADEVPPVVVSAAGAQVVTVQAQKPDNGYYTAKSAATATGLSLSLRDTPQSVSVVTRERMDDQAMATVGDALRNTIGVSLKPVDRGRNHLSARGFDINNFQLDGVPFATGNIGLETTSTVLYERIEVVRGATGLMSGAGDPSAAVNMVRKHADSRRFSGRASLELGSWNQRTGTIDLTVPLNEAGTVRARAVASATRQDAFIDLENKRQTVAYGVIDADLTPATRLSVGASDQRDKRSGVLWAGLPYWYADGTRTDWDRSSTTATRWNQWDTIDQSAFATLSHTLASQWTLRMDVSHRRQEEDSKLLWMWGDPDRSTGLGLEALPYHYLTTPKQTHVSATASGPFTLFGREHEAAVGLMRSKLSSGWSNRGLVGELPPLPDFNRWDGSYPEPALGERYDFQGVGDTTQSAAYAVARLQLSERLKLVAGARTSTWQRDETGSDRLRQTGVVTPYAGLVFDIGRQVSAYASYTEIFNPQTSRDRLGAFLDPLVGKSYEAGLKAVLMSGRLNASAALFRTDQDNFAVADPDHFVPGTNTPAMRAASGVRAKGYELELSGRPMPDWDLSLGWTQFGARDAAGVDVAVDHPRKQLKLFSKLALRGMLRGLSIGAGVNWEGDRPARATNPHTGVEERVGQPAYALIDLMARYDIDPRLGVQLNVSNALDRKYRSASHWWGAPYTYGEPRKLLLAVDARF